MKAKFFLSCMALAILFSACNTTNRTPKQKIEQQIDSLLKDKKATVGVAVLANDETVAVYNNQIHFPLLSVFKFQVRDALLRIGHLQEVKVMPIIGEEDPWHYRNKMQFPVAFENGILEIGCYAAATHKVVGVENCLIQKQRNNDIIAVVRQWMRQYEISAYDEKTGKGVVRHVMGRVGVNTGEVMAVIITAGYDIPHGKELVKMLRDAVPGLKSVVQNINKKQTNIVMGNKTRLLYGKTTIKDRLGTLKFNISAQSFFQVNSAQAEKLYNKAIEFAALSGGETVALCGRV